MSSILTASQLASAREVFTLYVDTLDESTGEKGLSVAALLQYVRDSGLPALLEGDIRDIVAHMKQTDTIAQRNSEVFALQGPGTANSVDVDGRVVVPFYLFVEISLMGERELLSMCNRTNLLSESDCLERELLDVFATVDVDGDGVLSSGDIGVVLETHFPNSSTETAKHIQAVLSELDINSDGKVDFDDFKKALKVS